MREEHTIHLVEIPLGGKEGLIWNRLHEEREDICVALLKQETEAGRHILQTRLRQVDDTLDRLMSGSYGHCSRCGNGIDNARLEIDPTLAFCRTCNPGGAAVGAEQSEAANVDEVALENLHAFDTDPAAHPQQPLSHVW